MVKVEFLGPIDRDDMAVDIKNLKQLRDILIEDKSIISWLDTCSVALNDTIVSSLDVELKDGDKISLLPPVCGG